MFLQIESDKFELGYARFLRRIKLALQLTFEEQKQKGITRSSIAAELGVDRSVVSKRLSGGGNVTLRTISDLFIAMEREPLENFSPEDENFNIKIFVMNNYYDFANSNRSQISPDFLTLSLSQGSPNQDFYISNFSFLPEEETVQQITTINE